MRRISFCILLLLFSSLAIGQKKLMNCKILEMISTEGTIFKQRGVGQRVLLLDTFQMFYPICSIENKLIVSEDLNSLKVSPKVFIISGIATYKNSLVISILQTSSNHQIVYYFSINGKEIKLEKTKNGDF